MSIIPLYNFSLQLQLLSHLHSTPTPTHYNFSPTWDTLYADAGRGLAVQETVDEAVAWANEFIEKIDKA